MTVMDRGTRFFVSFSSRDLKYVREIMAALEGQHLQVWNYSDIIQSIELGENINDRLISEMDACTDMVVVISKNSMDSQIGRFCRFEMEYVRNRISQNAPQLIPVLIDSHDKVKLEPPYDVFEKDFCQELDETPESIVRFTVKVCKLIDKLYIPPIEAHPSLPFWKLFRKEVEDMAHSNKEHVDLMMILGEFNEYYKKAEMPWAHFLISYFIMSCNYKVRSYMAFYPRIVKAVCESELGIYSEAMKSYEETKKIHPENQDVIGGIGTVFFKTGQYQKAADSFEQIINNTNNEDVTNAKINLIITNLAMGKEISGSEAGFLSHLDISGYSSDLKTAILNARGIYFRVKKDYASLEKLCREIMSAGLHDTVTVQLLQLSYLNRGMTKDAEEVIRIAIKEADVNPGLDKTVLTNYLYQYYK